MREDGVNSASVWQGSARPQTYNTVDNTFVATQSEIAAFLSQYSNSKAHRGRDFFGRCTQAVTVRDVFSSREDDYIRVIRFDGAQNQCP